MTRMEEIGADADLSLVAARIRLPQYMIPERYLRMVALPEIGSGKIDRVRVRQVVDRAYPVP